MNIWKEEKHQRHEEVRQQESRQLKEAQEDEAHLIITINQTFCFVYKSALCYINPVLIG